MQLILNSELYLRKQTERILGIGAAEVKLHVAVTVLGNRNPAAGLVGLDLELPGVIPGHLGFDGCAVHRHYMAN